MNSERTQQLPDQLDWLTRYFLRRLARAHRNNQDHDASPYSSGLFEATLISVVAPSMAVFSCLLITSLKWAPRLQSRWPNFSPKATALIIGCAAFVAGGICLGRKFRQYRDDPTAWEKFDSEADRQLIFWQKFLILSICGLLIPLLSLAATLWVL